MKANTLEHWGNANVKFSIYFKMQRRKKRYFLRETLQPGNCSTEIRITAAQIAELRNLRADDVLALTEAQIEWGRIQVAAGKRPQRITFTPRPPTAAERGTEDER